MPAFRFSTSAFSILPLLVMFATTSWAQAPTPEPVTDQETELGEAVYKQLLEKREIIKSSPLYDSLKPFAEAIARVAQPRYPHPFKFFLVHEAQPNAFATPGGNVYVVDSLLYFVKNTEELAGTLCHEVSHTIHRDGAALMVKEQKIQEREVAAAILLGPTRAHIIAIALIGKLQQLGYSRDAESKADVTGSDICAEAGFNPWGLAWLFQDFQNADTSRSRSFCQTILPMARGQGHSKDIFKIMLPLFPSSVATQNLQRHSACRKTHLRFSCIQTPRGKTSIGPPPRH